MSDLLSEFVRQNALSAELILSYVDEYSIYCHYIGAELELRTKYSSPLREGDEDPSFSLFYSKYKEDSIWFKDNAQGISGDVFTFVGLLMTKDKPPFFKDVLRQINSDLKIGILEDEVSEFTPNILKAKPVRKLPVKIEVTSRSKPTKEFLDYWKVLNISEKTLDKFYARNPEFVHYDRGEDRTTVEPTTLTISYEILGYYKIYQPKGDKEFKFRNDFPDVFVEGALQLRFNQEFVIITKATKECMFFYEHFGWECVAGKSENTPIPRHFMEHTLKGKYKYVFIWLDSDEAGIKAQQRYVEEYPWLIPIAFDSTIDPIFTDPTDLYTYARLNCSEIVQRNILNYLQQLVLTKINNNGRTNY